jgi:mono/diheme cytochrome c family protein
MAAPSPPLQASAEIASAAKAVPLRPTWKRTGLVIASLATVPLLMGLGKPHKIVDAEKFVLRDAAGQPRAELGLQAGQPSLTLFDERGQRRTRLVVSADGSTSVFFYDQNGEPRATLSVPPEGEPRLNLANKRQPALPTSVPVPAALRQKSPERSSARTRAVQGLYRQLCVTCHGDDGRGQRSQSRPNLPDFTSATWQARRTNAQLTASILNGRGNIMPAFNGRLNTGQAGDLVAFIRAFDLTSAQPSGFAADDFEIRFSQLQQEYDELKKQLRELSSFPHNP